MTNRDVEELTLDDLPVDMIILDTAPDDASAGEGEIRIVPRGSRRTALQSPGVSPISERDYSLSGSVPPSAQTARSTASRGVNYLAPPASASRPIILRGSSSRSSARAGSGYDSKRRASEAQLASLKRALAELEAHFGVSFPHDRLLKEASALELGPGEKVLKQGGKALGLCVVDSGVLQVTDAEERTVLAQLLGREMFGELSTLFSIPCSATVRVCPDQG